MAGLSHLAILIAGAMSVGIGNGLSTPSASASVMFVNREVSASASGLSGAIIVVMGAVATLLTGMLVDHNPTEKMLIAIMFAFALASLILAILVAFQKKNKL